MDAVLLTAVESLPGQSELQTFVERLTSTEGRLAVSIGVVALTLLVGSLLAPLLVRRTANLVVSRVPSGRASSAVDRVTEYVPTTISSLFLRTVQVGILLVAAITLLTVWGLVGLAIDVLTVLGLSIPLLVKVATTLGLGLVGYIASDILEESVERFADGSDRVTEHQREIIHRVGNISILALLIATGLTIWGVDLSGLLVGAGFLGIVVGLAARQTLGSLIAGFVLMFSRPFTIGDWVEIGDNEGIVTDITIVNTRLENFDGETIVIPNDSVSNQPIINRSERGHLRIRLDVGVDYATDPDHAADVAQQTIADLEVVANSPPPQVIPKSFGDSAVLLEQRFWIERPMPPRKWRAIEAVVTSVKRAFAEEGIKIPFPQQELSGRAETGGFRVREGMPERESVKPTTERTETAREADDGEVTGDLRGDGETAETDGTE